MVANYIEEEKIYEEGPYYGKYFKINFISIEKNNFNIRIQYSFNKNKAFFV